MGTLLPPENLSFVQRVLEEILEWPGNIVKHYGFGLLVIRIRVHGIGYEIVFYENLEVQRELTKIGRELKETGEFYKLKKSGCVFSGRAPDDWFYIHLFPRKTDADGSTSTSVGSDQCRERSNRITRAEKE